MCSRSYAAPGADSIHVRECNARVKSATTSDVNRAAACTDLFPRDRCVGWRTLCIGIDPSGERLLNYSFSTGIWEVGTSFGWGEVWGRR